MKEQFKHIFYLFVFLFLTSQKLIAEEVKELRFPVKDRLMVTKEDLSGLSEADLIKLMGHDLPWTRIAAVHVLAEKGVASIPIFEKALADNDYRVVRAGQDGLIEIMKKANKEEDKKTRKAVIETTPALLKTLKNKHFYVRMGALECFKAMGKDAKPAINEICPYFNDEDFMGVAPKAAAVVSSIGVNEIDSEVIVPVLSKAVRSVNMSVRQSAINLISKLDEKDQRKLIPDMIHAMKTPMRDGYTRFQVQGKVADVLEKLEVSEVVPLMIDILATPGWGDVHRINVFVPKIIKHGKDASAAIPLIEKKIEHYKETNRDKMSNHQYKLLTEALSALTGEQK